MSPRKRHRDVSAEDGGSKSPRVANNKWNDSSLFSTAEVDNWIPPSVQQNPGQDPAGCEGASGFLEELPPYARRPRFPTSDVRGSHLHPRDRRRSAYPGACSVVEQRTSAVVASTPWSDVLALFNGEDIYLPKATPDKRDVDVSKAKDVGTVAKRRPKDDPRLSEEGLSIYPSESQRLSNVLFITETYCDMVGEMPVTKEEQPTEPGNSLVDSSGSFDTSISWRLPTPSLLHTSTPEQKRCNHRGDLTPRGHSAYVAEDAPIPGYSAACSGCERRRNQAAEDMSTEPPYRTEHKLHQQEVALSNKSTPGAYAESSHAVSQGTVPRGLGSCIKTSKSKIRSLLTGIDVSIMRELPLAIIKESQGSCKSSIPAPTAVQSLIERYTLAEIAALTATDHNVTKYGLVATPPLKLKLTSWSLILWSPRFISSKGNEYFCEIDEDYLTDRFNLTGLNTDVQYYQYSLDLITDVFDLDCDDDMREQIEKSARHLYGLVHARYITTTRGLAKMLEKYKKADFGKCPRVICAAHPLLPTGMADLPHVQSVKLYCAKCEDLYNPKSSRHANIDGAYFGTSFQNILFQVYPALIPEKSTKRYEPKIFGFKVHAAAALARWQTRQRESMVGRLKGAGLGDPFREDGDEEMEEEEDDEAAADDVDAGRFAG